MIIPEVILLRIDQIANIATPITANVEENIKDKSLRSIPQAKENKKKAINNIKIFMYLNISLVLVILISARRPTLLAAVLKMNCRRTRSKIIAMV